MKISKSQLQKIIAEEVREHVKKKLLSENNVTPRTVKATPKMLRRIIAEEVSNLVGDTDEPKDFRHAPGEKTQDEIVRKHHYPNLHPDSNISDDPSRAFYVMDEEFLNGEIGGTIKLYYKEGSQPGPRGKKFVRTMTLGETKDDDEKLIYCLKNYDITDVKNLRVFVFNADHIVTSDVVSTDFFVNDGVREHPLIGYKRSY